MFIGDREKTDPFKSSMLTPHTRVDKVGARPYLDVYLLDEKTLEAALRPFPSAKYSFKYLSTEQPFWRRGCRAGRCRVSSCLRSQPPWAFRNHPLILVLLCFSVHCFEKQLVLPVMVFYTFLAELKNSTSDRISFDSILFVINMVQHLRFNSAIQSLFYTVLLMSCMLFKQYQNSQ